MKLCLRESASGIWGFTETYEVYKYGDTGNIKIFTSIDSESRTLSKPYVYRGQEYVPLSQIEEEMGIQKYIKAKKSFYSVVSSGTMIVKLKVGLNFVTGEYLEDKSTYDMYVFREGYSYAENNKDIIKSLVPIMQPTETVDKMIKDTMAQIALLKGDREKFLKARL